MAFGFGTLRLSSRDFWRMTPRELAAACGRAPTSSGAALDRAGLTALMTRFPDSRGT